MDSLHELKARLDRLHGRRDELERQYKDHLRTERQFKRTAEACEEALAIVRTVALETQRQLEFHLSELSSLALAEVFGDGAYRLRVEFKERRGRTECDIVFKRGRRQGPQLHPLSASGGGAVDVAAFALRLTLWTLEESAPVMIMDEPFRFVSPDLRPKAAALVKQLSERLGIQFVIVTNDERLGGCADKVFKVTKERKISKVEEV